MNVFDTIAAVSTPRGKGGVAMIRISGADAIGIASNVFFPGSGKTLPEIPSNKAVYGEVRAKNAAGELCAIDDALSVVYRAPHSFTGEDTVEICCHGGILLTEKVLTACLEAGCRGAEAGEFTRRAFINGKMSLSEAEGLGNLLEAASESQLLLSRGEMKGRLSGAIKEAYDDIAEMLASVYAGIDFPDEDLKSLDEDELLARAGALLERLRALEGTYRAGHAVAEGISTVICGRTNVGKSSLYNLILGREAAIVTDREGTTRDILEHTAHLGKVTLRLFDTAGLRETDDLVENIGIERANKALRDAELTIAVFDASRELSDEDCELISRLQSEKNPEEAVIAVLNKCDSARLCDATAEKISSSFPHCVKMSAKDGVGLSELILEAEELYELGGLSLGEDPIVTNARQHAALKKAIENLSLACEALSKALTLDICGTHLEAAMSALAQIDGREVTEEIVAQIFAHFCVGK